MFWVCDWSSGDGDTGRLSTAFFLLGSSEAYGDAARLERHSRAAGGPETSMADVTDNHVLRVAKQSDSQGLLEDKVICVKREGR